MADSRRCRRLEETRGPLLGVARCLGVGPETLLEVVYELASVLGALTACDTSKAARHVARS